MQYETGRTDSTSVERAWQKRRTLWQAGDLFHVSSRYPRNPAALRVDRLAEILRKGLLAPAQCDNGSVCSDLHLTVTGTPVPYDSLVFLHQFGPRSAIYTTCHPGRFAVLVDSAITVLTPESIGPNWVVLCQDEVYVPHRVERERLTGVAVHPADADSVLAELIAEFEHSEIPLYDYDGNILWPTRAA